jgi:plasmid stabilization system protein ParE
VTVLLAPEAEEDLRCLVDYLRDRNPTAAAQLVDRIFAIIDRLAAGEFEGPEQTLRTGDRVRSWPSPPVRIYYQRQPDALWVMRIYDQRRRPVAG